MGSKRKPEAQIPAEESDLLLIRPLYVLLHKINFRVMFWKLNPITFCIYRGAGQEVGRSCIMLEFKGKTIMVMFLLKKSNLVFNVNNICHHLVGLWNSSWFIWHGCPAFC